MPPFAPLPSQGIISISKDNGDQVVLIHQNGYHGQRAYTAIVFALFLSFPGYEAGLLDWLPFHGRSDTVSTEAVFSGLFGLLCLWMIYRAIRRPKPQRWVFGDSTLEIDTGIPAFRMISTAAPFEHKLLLTFPRRRLYHINKSSFTANLEQTAAGKSRLWLTNGDSRTELAQFVSAQERLWLRDALLQWQQER